MLVPYAPFMAAVHDFENVATAVLDVSCNIMQLRYTVFFLGGAATAVAVVRFLDDIGLTIYVNLSYTPPNLAHGGRW